MQRKVVLDFIQSDLYKGAELLHYLEYLLKDKDSCTDEVGKKVLEFGRILKLVELKHISEYVWDIATHRASDDVLKRMAFHKIARAHGMNGCAYGCSEPGTSNGLDSLPATVDSSKI